MFLKSSEKHVPNVGATVTTLNQTSQPLKAIILATFTAGTFDIVYAVASSMLKGRTAIGVLQSVASGLLGAGAFEGGVPTAAIGLLCHYSIILFASALFFFAFINSAFLRRNFWLVTAVFGALFYAVMHGIILPLSAIPFKFNYSPVNLAQGLGVHIFLVGLPINFFVRRFYREKFSP